MAVAGEIEKQAILGFFAVASDECIEGAFEFGTGGVEEGLDMEAIGAQGLGDDLHVFHHPRQLGPAVCVVGNADHQGMAFLIEPGLLTAFVFDGDSGGTSILLAILLGIECGDPGYSQVKRQKTKLHEAFAQAIRHFTHRYVQLSCNIVSCSIVLGVPSSHRKSSVNFLVRAVFTTSVRSDQFFPGRWYSKTLLR